MQFQADLIGPLQCELGFADSEGVPVALTRLPRQPAAHQTPVVLVHGLYTRRNFWVSDKGGGLAAYLAERGFDVWVVELRGHGNSPKTDRYREFTAEDHMRHDLPAVQRTVEEHTHKPAMWICHSAGGVYVAGALAAGWLDAAQVSALVTVGSQLHKGNWQLLTPPVVWVMRLAIRLQGGGFPAHRLGFGPELEPRGVMLEWVRWMRGGRSWTSSEGRPFMAGMSRVAMPVLCIAGAGDHDDPHEGCRKLFDSWAAEDRQFVLLGREAGFELDYGHAEMIISKAAQREVWPLIASWCTARA